MRDRVVSRRSKPDHTRINGGIIHSCRKPASKPTGRSVQPPTAAHDSATVRDVPRRRCLLLVETVGCR